VNFLPLDLETEIAAQEQKIAALLSRYEPRSLTLSWLQTLRAVEECINLVTVDWDEESADTIFEMRVADLAVDIAPLTAVHSLLSERFTANFAARFHRLALSLSAMAHSFANRGHMDVLFGAQTVGSLIGYLQSRRRHFVALLHHLPNVCRGKEIVTTLDALAVCLPAVELFGVQMMSAQNMLNVQDARARLGLEPDFAQELPMLDALYLEPERLRIDETDVSPSIAARLQASVETLATDRLFSAAELRNDILASESAYEEFGLAETSFAQAADLVRRISRSHVDKDFWVEISPTQLDRLFDAVAAPQALRNALTHGAKSYMSCLATYAPLVRLGNGYRSSVTLLSRFLYHWRSVCLDRQRRYQIRAGFLFEKAVIDALRRQGFVYQEITRIDHKEFDVITVRDGVIWNVQCKNNFMNLARVDCHAKRYARYNAGLVRSYERALTKERNREHLVTGKLGIPEIEHMIVARFPIVSDNGRLVPFSRIDHFAQLADSLRTEQSN
jgi:hypothetical protein